MPTSISGKIRLTTGEYGWEEDCVSLPNYFFTAVVYNNRLDEFKKILDDNNIEYEFNISEDSYIDHGYELDDFITEAFNDPDLLVRILFGEGDVYTGNDNGSEYTCMCYSARPDIYDYDSQDYISNPNHHPEKYDYYFKGN